MRQMVYKGIFCAAFSMQILSHTAFVHANDDMLLMKTDNEEEAFTVRRIVEFWKDGDFEIVKKQIAEFLSENPQSQLGDHLKGILGDLYLNERNFDTALQTYLSIQHPEVLQKTFVNKLQCYYELKQFPELSKEALDFLHQNKKISEDRAEEFYFLLAEALFNQSQEEEDYISKKDLSETAKEYYQKLLDTPYREISLFALAEIHRSLNEYEQAGAIYLELSEKYPDQREELLFHAATMQARYDEYSAIDNFKKVIAIRGEHELKAEYNLLALYFQTKQYSAFLDEAKNAKIPEEQTDTFHYMLGKSFYMTDDFANAKEPLQKFIASQEASTEYLKNALLIQMTCANKLDDEILFRTSLEDFQTRYPQDSELPKALFMHAMMCKNRNNLDVVKEELGMIMEKFPQFEEQESLLFEYGLVSHEKEDWEESYVHFKSFLEKYPQSKHLNTAWKYYLSSCFHLQQDSSQNAAGYQKEDFARDLDLVINKTNVLSPEEARDYRLLHGKILYQIADYQNSLKLYENYVKDYPGHESLGEAYYYLALNHFQINSSPDQFYSNMEKALELDPDLQEDSAVQLQLFNAYISHLNQLTDDKEKNDVIHKAASHLYSAYKLPNTELRMENKLWLANYYYEQLKNGSGILDEEALYERSKDLFSAVLLEENGHLRSIEGQNLFLEGEALKLADLLKMKKDFSTSLTLLQNLVEEQNNLAHYPWKFQHQALLELAKNYEVVKQSDKALETYQFLLRIHDKKNDPVKNEASLNFAKLQFAFLDKQKKSLSNPEVMEILNHLKDLQIKKYADTEPLHLEAALEYAKIRQDLAAEEERVEKYLFFLNRLREDFEAKNDPLSVAYHTSIKNSPDKSLVYQSYLKFVDAEILRMRAKLEASLNNNLEAEEYNEKALALLSEIKQTKTNPELEMRINQSINKINQFNSYD